MLVKDQVPIFYYGIYRLWTVCSEDLKQDSFSVSLQTEV